MKDRVRRALEDQLLRFILTGGTAAVLFYVLTYAFAKAGAPPFGGTVTAYAITMVASYTAQHAWTFGGQHAHARSLPRYLMAQLLGAVVSGLVARGFGAFGALPSVMAAASTLVAGAMSFTLSRYWVFAPRS